MKLNKLALGALFISTCTMTEVTVFKDGLVEYYGKQGAIVASGNAKGVLPISMMSGENGSYGVGAYDGLDGEITIFEGKPYVTKVRGDAFIMDHTSNGSAIFAGWTKNSQWRDEQPVPADVKTYYDLQHFIKARATAVGIDTNTTPFPFLMTGKAAELKWHINVDRTEGKPLTRELFKKSKANYVMNDEEVNIVGFYSEKHRGVFIGTYAPAMQGKDIKNALHIHFVSKDGKSAGHIDHVTFDGGMTLRLPK